MGKGGPERNYSSVAASDAKETRMGTKGKKDVISSDTVQKRPLTGRQLQTIAAVVGARSVEEGLRTAKVAKATYYSWLRDPTFAAEQRQQATALAETALHALTGLVESAIGVIRSTLVQGTEAMKLRAALAVFDRIARLLEMDRIQARLQKLEDEDDELKGY
jgi:hypothetical protein